jgi:hypothetical protein
VIGAVLIMDLRLIGFQRLIPRSADHPLDRQPERLPVIAATRTSKASARPTPRPDNFGAAN